MKYVRYDAPPELRLRFHFRDKFGEDIKGAREYDPATGEGRGVPYPGAPEDNLVPFFKPEGYVEIDGHVNPSEETLTAVFANSKAVLQKDIMDKVVKHIEQEVHYREGKAALSS